MDTASYFTLFRVHEEFVWCVFRKMGIPNTLHTQRVWE
jgi:hypothetical protein